MYKNLQFVLLVTSTLSAVQGFVLPRSQTHHQYASIQQQQQQSSSTTSYQLNMAKPKGFGDSRPKTTKPKKVKIVEEVVQADGTIESTKPTDSNPFPSYQESDMSQGKIALEKMRRDRAEKRNEELRKAREMQETDQLLREQPGAAAIPEKVAQRMGARMLPFVGIPLIGGMAAFVGFWYMATYQDMEYQPALVAATTIGMLAFGLVGITYSVMSASWDEDREGTFLGTDEFSKNVDNIKEGLTRSRDNARLRDLNYSPEDIAELDRNEGAKEKRRQSFYDKFGKDLD